MKINKLKINAYGKLKEKEINFSNQINIIYGKNEAGKSTILNFIKNSFFGISKNKNGKDISEFEKYTPWRGEEFSGKMEYELDDGKKFEIFRNFNKKNPQIFNEEMEDISKQFNIDKNKGNEFFYEQTKVDETLFSSTIFINQQEVKLGKQEQNVFIQKIANLIGTGEDNVSYKRAMERINKRLLDEIGTERSREKPINIIQKTLCKLEEQKEQLEKNIDIKYKIEEDKHNLIKEIDQLEQEDKILKQKKLNQENKKIENEKVNLKINLQKENQEKINFIKNKIETIKLENKNLFEKEIKINLEKNKLNKKIIIILIGIILINILQLIIVKNKWINGSLLFTILIDIIISFFLKNKKRKQEIKIKNKIEKINTEIKQLNFEIELLEKNNQQLEDEINTNKLEKKEINNLQDINLKIQNIQNKLNDKKIKLHTLELDYKNIEPQLESLPKVEEEIVENQEKMENLKNLEKSMNLAKEVLENAYEKMKSTVTPKFTDKLSETIKEITNGTYSNVNYHDEIGLVVELENGNYVPASRLSIGTIDQLYLSLRLAMVEELSAEKMPIILDEVFAYFDTDRLTNILKYLVDRFKNYQILIFTCTNREKEILETLNLPFNLIKM